jgi:hypothetical protein
MKTRNHDIPFSGGPKGALASRGAETAERALRRLWAALRH